MSTEPLRQNVTVKGRSGLHMRAASLISELVAPLDAKVTLCKGDRCADAGDVLQILTLCAMEGDQLTVEASGPDAKRAIEMLTELFETGLPASTPANAEDGKSTEEKPSGEMA